MKKEKVKNICDCCGSYWNANPKTPDNCAICGCGSKMVMDSKIEQILKDGFEKRVEERRQAEKRQAENSDVSV